MILTLQVVCVLLTSIAMGLSLAHALELPGKLRLNKEEYLMVQKIYYPGFTVGGFGEVLGLVAILTLLLYTPTDNRAFGWTLASFVVLAITHALYWVLTHPVNNFWLKDHDLKGLGKGFFATGANKPEQPVDNNDDLWKRYRDRWEQSHVIRAVLSIMSLPILVVAIAAERP